MRSSSGNKLSIIGKALSFIMLLACCLVMPASAQKLPDPPNPPKLVVDFTNTLTADQADFIERKLVAFDDTTSTQIAVVIVPSTDGQDVAQYAVDLGRKWGIGGSKFNNGVLLLIAKNDHRLNIATGYGVEGALPDITAKHIIDEEIVPNFKGDDYFRGIDEGTDAIIQAVKGEYHEVRKKSTSGKAGGGISVIIFIIILVIVLSARGGGGKGGGFMSRRGYRDIIGPMILSDLLGGGRRGGGGWSGGGGGWSGGGGGGGFGGFGGGSFGGGGASGSW